MYAHERRDELTKALAAIFAAESALPLPPPTYRKQNTMSSIEVGKVIVHEAQSVGYGSSTPEYGVAVGLSSGTVYITVKGSRDGNNQVSDSKTINVTPEQAIEVAQLILKAAETVPGYTEAMANLDEERKRITAKYKDLVSGLGTDVDVDVNDGHSTFTFRKALG